MVQRAGSFHCLVIIFYHFACKKASAKQRQSSMKWRRCKIPTHSHPSGAPFLAAAQVTQGRERSCNSKFSNRKSPTDFHTVGKEEHGKEEREQKGFPIRINDHCNQSALPKKSHWITQKKSPLEIHSAAIVLTGETLQVLFTYTQIFNLTETGKPSTGKASSHWPTKWNCVAD